MTRPVIEYCFAHKPSFAALNTLVPMFWFQDVEFTLRTRVNLFKI